MADGRKDTALGLGERLRSARKARALSLEQAAEALRLPLDTVRALEEERFAVLGAAVFVRGHLKAYARLLDLSEEAVLAAWRAADPGAEAQPAVARKLEQPLRPAPGALALLVVAAIVLAVAIAWWLAGSGSTS